MLIFRDSAQQQPAEPPRRPTAPIWSRKPQDFEGKELIAEARIRADFIQLKDSRTADWIRALADQLEVQFAQEDILQKQIGFALEDRAILSTERDRLNHYTYELEYENRELRRSALQ